ncbi:MOS1T transposase, partial [Pseudoatta argentina]
MSIFVPNKVYLRGILLHYFIQKKSAAEAHRILVQTYGDNALSDTTCRDWFRRFKNNDFQLEDKERSGAPKKFQDKELEQILDEDPSQTLSELGKILQVDESIVSKRLKGLGMIQKQGHWVPYELKPRDVERRFGTCELLLQRQKRKEEEWPPRSPDLSLLDYFYWGYLKSKVFETKPVDINELQARIINVSNSITPEMLRNVQENIYIRMGHCQVHGQQFEHLIH